MSEGGNREKEGRQERSRNCIECASAGRNATEIGLATLSPKDAFVHVERYAAANAERQGLAHSAQF
jgi:hypothetical protein